MKLRLHIYSRIILAIATSLMILLGGKTPLVIVYFSLVIIIGLSGFLKEHLRLILAGMIPVYLSFIFIYVFVLNEPNVWQQIHSRIEKILLFTTLFQIVLIYPTDELFYSLKKVGVKGNLLIIILSSYTLIDDISRRSQKIINARLSRGYVKKRTRFTMMRQLPYVLRPLFIQVFRSSFQRADNWQQKDMITLIRDFKKPLKYNWYYNIGILLCFLIFNLVFQLQLYLINQP